MTDRDRLTRITAQCDVLVRLLEETERDRVRAHERIAQLEAQLRTVDDGEDQ